MEFPSAYDPATLAFYEANARSYSEARPDEPSEDLLAFLPRLPFRSKVLELGCGSGTDALAMEKLGLQVDATDGVSAMVAIADKRLSRGARMMRFDQLVAENEYDAVVACASFLHVPANELPALATRVWVALKPGGWHFASFKTGGTPGWDRHGRYYNQLDQAGAENVYSSAAPWDQLLFDSYDGVGHFSEPSRWLTVVARKGG